MVEEGISSCQHFPILSPRCVLCSCGGLRFNGPFSFFLLSYPSPLPSVWGLGVDPSLQIDVLTELELGESTAGVRQVPGLHNGTKAFLFQGMAQCEAPVRWEELAPRLLLTWRCSLARRRVPAGAWGPSTSRVQIF